MGIEQLMHLLKKISGRDEPKEELPDDQTRDHHLRSLRRERRVQMELVEKRQLKKDLEKFKKNELRKNMFGMKSSEEKKEELIDKLNKKKEQINVMASQKQLLQEGSLLNNRKDEFKKKQRSILSNHGSMLGKGNL